MKTLMRYARRGSHRVARVAEQDGAVQVRLVYMPAVLCSHGLTRCMYHAGAVNQPGR